MHHKLSQCSTCSIPLTLLIDLAEQDGYHRDDIDSVGHKARKEREVVMAVRRTSNQHDLSM
jgi:hypothetical protein